jgi:uncharacterized membrane protein
MALVNQSDDAGAVVAPVHPAVRKIGFGDLRDALAKGLDDFNAYPTHAVMLSIIYPIVGLILGGLVFRLDVLPLLYPIAAGFALLGPFAAIGLYEVSRCREQGLQVNWRNTFGVLRSRSIGDIVALGLVLMALFVAWLAAANAIYALIFGDTVPTSIDAFARQILTTPSGATLLIVGNAVGFVFALVAFAISVISFPLLVDRQVGAPIAVLTSISAILKNPVPMLSWGFFVAVCLALGSLPFLFGLAVVVPILGHATWHLYRKVVVRDPS